MATELRAVARAVLCSPDLEAKLRPPPAELSDTLPGDAERLPPARCERLRIAAKVKVPPLSGMADLRQRARIVHAFANHELQAVELFAWAVLAFPQAPPTFRRGLLALMADEQRHLTLYCERLQDWGVALGDHPLSGYFWKKVDALQTPLEFVCAMGLTFEAANLDHALEYAQVADAVGDPETAALFRRVQREEVAHVRFAWRWLERLKPPAQSHWDAFVDNLHWPLRPELSTGRSWQRAARERAGFDGAFLDRLAEIVARTNS